MKIYIQSAGTIIDYHWLNEPQNSDIIKWHLLLGEQDKAFALVAGYSEGSWHIELRNLLLSSVTDEIASRQIVFNICFSELKSEEEVRALALAYLDSELKRKKDGRPIARCIPKLAAAYKATKNGAYDYNPEIAIEWAKKAIAEGKKVLKSAPESERKLRCTINPNNEDKVKRLRKHLEETALTQKEGLRLIWSDIPQGKDVSADVILRYTDESTDSWEISEAPRPKEGSLIQKVIDIAKVMVPQPCPVPPRKLPRQAVQVIIGMGIFALILGLLAAVLCLPDKKKEDSKPQTPSKIETGIVAPPHDIPSTKGEKPTAPDKPAPAEPAPAEPAPAVPAAAIPAT